MLFVLFDGVLLLDVSGPAEVFATANRFGCDYRLSYVSPIGSVVPSAGLVVSTATLAEAALPVHTLVVPGGARSSIDALAAEGGFTAWLRGAAKRATRVVSICTGAFLLGHAGLLDARRVTTHWADVDDLQRRFPQSSVDGDKLFIEDRNVWTSAGAATGIDMALAIVARDAGPHVALAVARALVLHLVRPGGQSQFSAPLSFQVRAGGVLAGLVPWLETRLHAGVSVTDMASGMGMSVRTFHRRCIAEFGMPPARLIAELRLDRARLLLGDPTLTISTVADRAGFLTSAAFSKAFTDRYGTSPSAYRQAFSAPIATFSS